MDDSQVDITEDLDAFEADFYELKTEEAPEEEVEADDDTEDSEENEDDPLATDEDEDGEDEDEDEADDSNDEEDEPEPEPKPKPKNKTQLRIEKLLERERLANERAEALEKRLAALESSKEEKHEEPKPKELREMLPEDAPSPDALNDKGEALYPLGEFDPQYILDLTEYSAKKSIDKAMKEAQDKAAEEARNRQILEARQEIQKNYVAKLEEFEEEVPTVREDIKELVDTFKDVEPNYGDYLASTIMASDLGPQIMHYLSQNIGEAQDIVASGPAAATRMIGRLEARLERKSDSQKEEKRNKKRVSSAPEPAESRSRGAQGRFRTKPDTDDLDAFEREFYKD